MKKINFYIGSNNKTKILEKEKAIKILANSYEGMNISELIGYWKGSQEKTLLISIVCDNVDYTLLKNTAKKINKDLDQDAVMVEILDSNTIFINER
jgi:hypothetical protein